jgi:AmmeMemoRadiSam system protein B
MKRRPAVAGQFYSSSPSKLEKEVQQYIEVSPVREKSIGIVSPHAGLMYSGAVAGAVYSRVELPHTFVLIGPNHAGLGKPVAIVSQGEWEIPSGMLKIDGRLAEKISERSEIIEHDTFAHSMEHSLEMQLPFILHLSSQINIVPITMMVSNVRGLDSCKLVGTAIADAIKNTEYAVTIIASSDMSHYETDAVARAKDKKAIDKILDLEPEGLFTTVMKENISMCGFVPVTAMLYAARELGAQNAYLVKYMTSGEVSGDYGYVVGYAGIIIR